MSHLHWHRGLPLINHFIERLGLEAHLDAFVPTWDRRTRLPYAKSLGVLVRSLLIEREPMYRQHESVNTFAPAAFGLDGALVESLSDDAIGRALDRLFDADRAVLLTACVVSAVERFVKLAELHNDCSSPPSMSGHRGFPKPQGSPRIHDHGVRHLPKFNSEWDNPRK